MKILFTCVGRRVELVQEFKKAGKELGLPLTVCATDMTNTAPAAYFCDEIFIAPRISDENYLPFLLELCQKEKVDALIPTIDTDLLLLAKNRERFEKIGTKVLVANEDKIAICRDKRKTSGYFESLGLSAPKPFAKAEEYDLGFPAFIKPLDGSSSIDAYKVKNQEELFTYAEKIGEGKYVVQPFIDGEEYTVDIFCNLLGEPIYITPRIRLAVRAGEVLKTQIRQDAKTVAEMQKLVADFKPRGGCTVQLIKDKKTGENYYIEINPRFGGGAPLSMKAGANSAKALIRILQGERVEYAPSAADDLAIFSRFDQSVRVN